MFIFKYKKVASHKQFAKQMTFEKAMDKKIESQIIETLSYKK